MADKTTPPNPGIYEGIPFEQYLTWDCLNGSTLVKGLQRGHCVSAKHLHGYITGAIEDPESKDRAFGSAMHTRLLEPDKFAERHPIAGQCQAILKSGQRKGEQCQYQGIVRSDKGEWFCGTHGDESMETLPSTITSVQADKIEQLAKEIVNHPAVKLFHSQGGVEKSFVWDQPVTFWMDGKEIETTIRMKGRVDKDIDKPPSKVPPMIVDVKKVQRGCHTDEAFAREIDIWYYAPKAALYVDGLEILDGIKREFVWCAVEDSFPFDVNPIQADEETLEVGRFQYNELLSLYAKCQHTGYWPGVSAKVHRGGLPEYVKRLYRKD